MVVISPDLYTSRTTAAVRAVLVEMGQILASYRGKFAIVGGSVPWLLLPGREMPHVPDFAVQRASGAELALLYPALIELDGRMPDGCRNRVRIAVASIPALLAMKGFAIQFREKQKDAYDIYYCVRNYPGGISSLAEAC